MKLATLRNNRPDGQLVVLSADHARCVSAGRIAPTLQAALDDWAVHAPALSALAAQLDAGAIAGQPFDPAQALAPLPRAYQWIDGSGYLSHLERVRTLKGSKDEELQSARPLLYQGGSDSLSAPTDPIRVTDPDLAIDFEAEVAVIIGAVPMAATKAQAASAIRLITVCNDVSLRRLVADDLQNGFGFFHAKPSTRFAPIVATPESLGAAWHDNRRRHRLQPPRRNSSHQARWHRLRLHCRSPHRRKAQIRPRPHSIPQAGRRRSHRRRRSRRQIHLRRHRAACSLGLAS